MCFKSMELNMEDFKITVEKLRSFAHVIKHTKYIKQDDIKKSVFIDSNLMTVPCFPNILTDDYIVTNIDLLIHSLVRATGSYFSNEFFDFRMKIFKHSVGKPSNNFVNDICLLQLTNLADIIRNEEICKKFLLEKIKDIVKYECPLDIVDMNDHMVS